LDELAWEQYGVVMQRIAAMPKLSLRFYLDVGKFENDFHPSPLTANRHLRDVLIAKGYALKYQEFAGHHSPVNLRGTFSDALMFCSRTNRLKSRIPPTAVGGYFQIQPTVRAFVSSHNPTNGSWWILSDPAYR
jgi:hypothetical protein